jgi:predicted Rossmann-fold nucleotide-binding protein
MANYSTGGFIVLPGGYGTFEEMMEMITWNQASLPLSLGYHLTNNVARHPLSPRNGPKQYAPSI